MFILQYADDTILFLENAIDKAVNMKLILDFFKQLSVMKINFHKSEFFCFGKVKEDHDKYREIFKCKVGTNPFKYLGIHVHYQKVLNLKWKMIEDRFNGSWRLGYARCSHTEITLY